MRLTPQTPIFYTLFTRSAEQHVVAAGLLTELLGATADDRLEIAAKTREAEHAGDEITHEIYRTANSTFVTPFDREDIYRLASAMDDVIDEMEAAVELVVLYNVGEFPPEFADVVGVLNRAAELTLDAMPRLRTMRDLSEYWIEVNRLENQADKSHRRLLARLFSGEYDAMTVLKLKDVAEALEAAADAFEKVANVVESIAVKES